MRRVISPVVIVVLGLVAGCGGTATPADTKKARQELAERATVISQAWSKTAKEWDQRLVLLDNPVKWLDDSQLTEQQSAGFDRGNYEGDVELPPDVPPGTVEFDGGEVDIATYDAAAAHGKLTANSNSVGDCPRQSQEETHGEDDDAAVRHTPACGVLTITDMRLGSDQRWTNQGLIEMPTWLYSVDGVDEPVSQLAFDAGEPEDTLAVDVSHMPKMEETVAAEQLRAVSDSAIVFTVATGDCRTNERGLAHETEEVIVVGGISDPTGETQCNASQGAAPVDATLDSPIAGRMVVDASSGDVLTHRGPFPQSPMNY